MVQPLNKDSVIRVPAPVRAAHKEQDAWVGNHACRRMRHLSSIQIHNFTPFPVRDAAASALSQPLDLENPRFSPPPEGHFHDDSEVVRPRRRSRRISAGSVVTLRNTVLRGDDEVEGAGSPESLGVGDSARRGRPRSTSVASTRGQGHARTGSGRFAGASGSPQMQRRTSLAASTSALMQIDDSAENTVLGSSIMASFPRVSAFHLDSSQKNLEKVLKSRLVETMITLTTVPSRSSGVSPDDMSTHRQSTAQDSASVARSQLRRPIPDFLSDIHRPSTNPVYTIRPGNFSSWTDVSTDKVMLTIYGKLPIQESNTVSISIDDVSASGAGSMSKGKGRAQDVFGAVDDAGANSNGWTVLEEWTIDLNQLVLIDDDSTKPTRLPYNSPVFSFGSANQRYRLPARHDCTTNLETGDEETTEHGYGSDTDADPRTAASASGNIARSSPKRLLSKRDGTSAAEPPSPTRRRGAGASSNTNRSATWQDLIKLGTLQTCILETESSKDELVSTIGERALSDGQADLHRQVAEQEYRVQTRQSSVDIVLDGCEDYRKRIAERREELAIRKLRLASAAAMHAADLQSQADAKRHIQQEQRELATLRSKLLPARKTLISTLSYVFPIDLASPEDLLFTIVGAPLPIPVASTDPAPPLVLPAHRDVTEDSVATALGYAAFVVQHVAAYLGHRLVYPITYVGSRSLIKDEVSAMQGPRMFPLYSKGVDTYRFEYGVFLLNKNVEMLMADRDLRALDIRHTLPNLKNLLLTLTDRDEPRAHLHLPKLANQTSTQSLRSLISSTDSTLTTTHTDATEIGSSSTGSGDSPSTPSTPTQDTPEETTRSSNVRKPAKGSYFGLSPLSSLGFLRGRYPPSVSSKPSVIAVAEANEEETSTPTHTPTASTIGGGSVAMESSEDDADRVTIRGITVGSGAATNGTANGNSGTEDKTPIPESRPTNGNARWPLPAAVASRDKEVMITVTPATPAPPVVT